MSARLLILVAVAAGLAVYFATRKPAAPASVVIEETETMTPEQRAKLEELQKPLYQRDLKGETPPEEPRLSVRFEVDNSKGKNRLVFYISEENGYYVDTFDIDFWYKSTPDMTREQSPLSLKHTILNRYLPANETLKDCLELNDAEMNRINENMGSA